MATTKAREDIKNDLKTLKEDLKTGAREETQRLKAKAADAEARLGHRRPGAAWPIRDRRNRRGGAGPA